MRIATLVPPCPGTDDGSLATARVSRRPVRGIGTYIGVGIILAALSACQPGATDSAADAASDTVKGAADAAADGVKAVAENMSTNSSGNAEDSMGDSTDGLLGSDAAKASYTMGFGLTSQATGQFGDAIDHEAFVAGVRAQLEGKDSVVPEEDARKALTNLNDVQQAKAQVAASSNAKIGASFLAENGAKEGVVTTASGLQYLVLTQGSGAKPTTTDTVKTHYQGTLIGGEVFDSSYERGQPATFPLNRVIAGWTEALQLMNPGSKYRLFIPPELAYGNQATGSIPPQSTLIFEVELLEIMGADSQ